MTEAVGPIYAAGFQHITKSGYKLLYLADLHNEELQKEGKAPVYWWLQDGVELATTELGHKKFNFIHFVGKRSQDTTVGAEGDEEVSGGLLAFSTTSSPPAEVLRESEQELLDRFRGNDDKWWGWRTNVAPMFRPAPIVSNITSLTNLSPNPDGTIPTPTPAPSGGGGGAGGGGVPAGGGGGAPVGPGGPPNRNRALDGSRPPLIVSSHRVPQLVYPRSVPLARAYRASNLDMWYANLQGQGSGSVSPFAENAYSGLVGSMPAALIWASFHGGTGGISVWQKMKMKVWTPMIRLAMHGDWKRIQDFYSGEVDAGGLFWHADIEAQFNNLRTSGAIEVVTEIDSTVPGADKLQEEMNKRSDLVFQKFMEQAQKTIFEPAPFQEKPAEASGGFLGFGGGAAFKMRRDTVSLRLDYEERKELAYLQDYPISGQLEGLYDEIQADPEAEKRYFTALYLDDWDRKVSRTVKAVVNWPDAARQWVGEPVAFVSCQVGYPNTEGAVQWDGHIFQAGAEANSVWNTAAAMKKASDVSNPPAGWTPDKMFVKRQIHFTEPPNETENPFARVQVEQNVFDLDPGELGSLSNDINLEVRVDSAGTLNVGPIILDVDLETPKQMVEVSFWAEGQTSDGNERSKVKFNWQFTDQTEPRYWMLFTGQPDFVAKYKYQVRVIVKGTIFAAGQEWTGPEEDMSGNGPLTIRVPRPDDEGVVTREIPFSAVGAATPPSGGNGARPPHDNRPPARPTAAAGNRPPMRDMPGESDSDYAGWPISTPATRSGNGSRGAPAADEEPMFEGYTKTRPAGVS